MQYKRFSEKGLADNLIDPDNKSQYLVTSDMEKIYCRIQNEYVHADDAMRTIYSRDHCLGDGVLSEL